MKGKILSLMRCLMMAAVILPCFCSCDETKLSAKYNSSKNAGVVESVTLDSSKGSSKTIYVSVEETGWTARVAPDCEFLSVSPERGTESGDLTITATSDNVTGKDRMGTVIIESTALDKYGNPELSQTIEITQTVVRLEGSLTIPAEAPQHGDFVIRYQPKNGEEWERTLTAGDYTIDPDNSQRIIHHLNLPVNAETGKVSLWFRNHSNGYTFDYSCQFTQVQKKGSDIVNTSITDKNNIVAETPQTDYFIACFLWEMTDNGLTVNKGSESDIWPELTEEQKNSVADAVTSVLKKAYDAIDNFLAGENPSCEFSESLPADIFADNFDIKIKLSREGGLIQIISSLITTKTENWNVYRKYNATEVKAMLASPEFTEEMSTATEWQIRKILYDRLFKQ